MDKVSFIIPTYRRKNFLIEAISSIFKLNRNNIEVEIIVIDDDPFSKIKEVLFQAFYNEKILYFRNNLNMGAGYSRARGLNFATGDFVVFMDDDDIYNNSDFLKMALRELNADKSLSMVGFNAVILNEKTGKVIENNLLNTSGFIDGLKYLKKFSVEIDKPLSTFTTVFSKKHLIYAGIDKVKMLNDTVIYLYSLTTGNAFLRTENIGLYRIHSKNISKTLSQKFIIDNLDEKISLSKKLPFSSYDRVVWNFRQCSDSILYYLGSNYNWKQNKKIKMWVKKQTLILRLFLMTAIRKAILKKRIKVLLHKTK